MSDRNLPWREFFVEFRNWETIRIAHGIISDTNTNNNLFIDIPSLHFVAKMNYLFETEIIKTRT